MEPHAHILDCTIRDGSYVIDYQFTVEDPSLFKQPWLAEFMLYRSDLGFLEYACHEGNHSLIHILTAARLGMMEEDD